MNFRHIVFKVKIQTYLYLIVCKNDYKKSRRVMKGSLQTADKHINITSNNFDV